MLQLFCHVDFYCRTSRTNCNPSGAGRKKTKQNKTNQPPSEKKINVTYLYYGKKVNIDKARKVTQSRSKLQVSSVKLVRFHIMNGLFVDALFMSISSDLDDTIT